MDILLRVDPVLYNASMQIVAIMHPKIQKDLAMLEDLIVRVFNRLDKNSNGSVSRGELRTFLFDFYTNSKAERNVWAVNVIHKNDRNDDDVLDVVEFRNMIVDTLNTQNLLDTIRYMQMAIDAPCIHENTPHKPSHLPNKKMVHRPINCTLCENANRIRGRRH